MFFFVAGVQPRTVKLEDRLERCPSCGLYQARVKRVDHYLSVFFLPVLRVKKGVPFLECDRCGSFSAESREAAFGAPGGADRSCPQCGRRLGPDYRYCPSCGKALV